MTLPPIAVELYSDTQTRPTAAMRRAMAEAEVGDEQQHEDPEVNALCAEVADLLGKEAAVFMPSGTMCNEVALAVHCRPGEEVLVHETAHPIHAEAGGPAVLARVILTPLPGARGIFGPGALEARIRTTNRHAPRSRLVSIEQTSNLGGGTVWTLAQIRAVTDVARRHGLATHMDGARLMNAVVASGVAARDFCAPVETAWIDFSKGLGAPVGAVLAGSRPFVDEAWRFKQMIGGAMRQAGILAAACRHALRHHVDRLAADHANARRLARGLAALPGILLDPDTVETNIVLFEIAPGALDAAGLVVALRARGVRMGAMGPRVVRAVTHLDVDEAGIDRAVAATAEALRA
jgi:threonine aldolase